MLQILLQLWGGLFFLLNKIFFSLAERATDQEQTRQWRIWSWTVYLLGLPAWVIIFVNERNWIAAALEASGAPSMILGLIIAIKGNITPLPWLDYLAYTGIILGLGGSLYDFHGITTINQYLEIGIATGYLIGTHLLAHQHSTGYLWLLLMSASNAALMAMQGYYWLTIQQLLSLGFIIDAFLINQRKSKQSA